MAVPGRSVWATCLAASLVLALQPVPAAAHLSEHRRLRASGGHTILSNCLGDEYYADKLIDAVELGLEDPATAAEDAARELAATFAVAFSTDKNCSVEGIVELFAGLAGAVEDAAAEWYVCPKDLGDAIKDTLKTMANILIAEGPFKTDREVLDAIRTAREAIQPALEDSLRAATLPPCLSDAGSGGGSGGSSGSEVTTIPDIPGGADVVSAAFGMLPVGFVPSPI